MMLGKFLIQPSIKSTTQDELKDVYRFYNYKECASTSKSQD